MTFRAARRRKREINDARAHPIAWILRRAAADAGSVHGARKCVAVSSDRAARTERSHRRADDWPRTPIALSKVFAGLSAGLRELGVIVFPSRAMIGGTVHRVWRVESGVQPQPPAETETPFY